MTDPLTLAKAKVGGNTGLARALADRGHRVTPQAVGQWTRVPAARARDVAEITGVPLHALRPDLWAPPTTANVAS